MGNDFGECGVGDQVFDGVIFLNGPVCQVVEERCHLLCLFNFGSLISTNRCLASSHAIDIAHLGRGSNPVGLLVGPSVVNDRAMFSLAPGQRHVAAHQGVLGTCGDHGFIGDEDSAIGGNDLKFLLLPLVDGKGGGGVNAGMEVCHVVIQIRLADLGVGINGGLVLILAGSVCYIWHFFGTFLCTRRLVPIFYCNL